jgi:hypothetical protein
MRYEDRTQLLTPEVLAFESGIERLPDGTFHVAVLTPMRNVRAEMIAWWFGSYMQTTEHYKMWHPRDHVWMDWENKTPGDHVGAHHLVHEYIGGQLNRLRISFIDPEDNLGPESSRDGRLFICAKVGLLDRPVSIGRMVHALYDTEWGCEMRSHFWLGHVETNLLGGIVQKLANTAVMRKRVVSRAMAYGLEAHCHEEMSTLARFLPGLFETQKA